ncbi:MAG: hypothetical protein JRH16_13830 [Deltaproteobacteria bacterium]|nr:hypothetical protein [Deltaproteobacteria bacterium]MBW2359799.1 hypothetical protein [Deltaproteobacteria bacterium]
MAGAQRWLTAIYRLDLELDAARCVVEPECAREWLPPGSPRTGLVVVEQGNEAFAGIYVDPSDAEDENAVLEETSHLVCLAWHAAHDRPVSRLQLELQSEVDRYAVARLRGRDGFAHFRGFRWAAGMSVGARRRYRAAQRAGLRTCVALERRHPGRADTPGWLAELRRYYRASPCDKLNGQAARVR